MKEQVLMYKTTGQLCLVTNTTCFGTVLPYSFLAVEVNMNILDWNDDDFINIGELE